MDFYAETTLFPAEHVIELAATAEASGWAGLSLADHAVYPMTSSSPYPYTADGNSYIRPEHEWHDPIVLIAAAAASTSTLKFMTGVYVLPMRHPVCVAKALSTLDSTAPGRTIFGVGAGWWREEFDVMGQPFDGRGRRMDEAIEVIRALLTGGPVGYHGTFYDFPPVTMRPAPARAIPIYIGGTSKAALDRAARLGDGLVPVASGIEHIRELVPEMDRRREAAGRGGLPFEVVGYTNDCRTLEEVLEFAAVGVSTVRVNPFRFYVEDGEIVDQTQMPLSVLKEALERYAAEFVVPLREA
jgi:probable F420-dependent oxidoreductase